MLLAQTSHTSASRFKGWGKRSYSVVRQPPKLQWCIRQRRTVAVTVSLEDVTTSVKFNCPVTPLSSQWGCWCKQAYCLEGVPSTELATLGSTQSLVMTRKDCYWCVDLTFTHYFRWCLWFIKTKADCKAVFCARPPAARPSCVCHVSDILKGHGCGLRGLDKFLLCTSEGWSLGPLAPTWKLGGLDSSLWEPEKLRQDL